MIWPGAHRYCVSGMVRRVLLIAATTGYQTRAFVDAAAKLGVRLVYGVDQCRGLDNPWGDEALAVRFRDDPASLDAIVAAHRAAPVAGIVAVGDRPAVLAARAAERLGLPFHPPAAADTSLNKLATRSALRASGLPVPGFTSVPASADAAALAAATTFPCVIKPLALSGSRGVMRVDAAGGFPGAFDRLRHVLMAPDVTVQRDPAHGSVLIEDYIAGAEFAVEALMTDGRLRVLAIFDKPDPLDGPYFEETLYVTPSSAPASHRAAIVDAVTRAAAAIGLRHGPVHAECRVNPEGVFVLEAAARPIGGLCARALRFRGGDDEDVAFEELLLRHAMGEDVEGVRRTDAASGVMMLPIPRGGVYRGVSGVEDASAIPYVTAVQITAKPGQMLVPLPEGASYLGFAFATAPSPADVVTSLRAAQAALRFEIDRELPLARRG